MAIGKTKTKADEVVSHATKTSYQEISWMSLLYYMAVNVCYNVQDHEETLNYVETASNVSKIANITFHFHSSMHETNEQLACQPKTLSVDENPIILPMITLSLPNIRAYIIQILYRQPESVRVGGIVKRSKTQRTSLNGIKTPERKISKVQEYNEGNHAVKDETKTSITH